MYMVQKRQVKGVIATGLFCFKARLEMTLFTKFDASSLSYSVIYNRDT